MKIRKELKAVSEQRMTFTAEFGRYGTKQNFGGGIDKTILLKNVCFADGKPACDHIWFMVRKTWEAMGELTSGEIVQFDARVKAYQKGYKGHRIDAIIENPVRTDYKLSHPTKIRKIVLE